MNKQEFDKAAEKLLDEEIAKTTETREIKVVVNANAAHYVMVELRYMKGVESISSPGKDYKLIWRKKKKTSSPSKEKSRRSTTGK